MIFQNIYFGSFFFFNVEGLFFFMFILFINFLLIKNYSFKIWLLYNVQGKIEMWNKKLLILINFFVFCVFVLFYVCYCLYDKRFFFFDLNYYNNSYIVLFKLILLLIFVFVLLFSISYFERDKILTSFEFFVLIWLSILGMFLMLSSCDFISFYLCIEIQSISFYILAGYKQISILSIESGLKYFILGSFSSGLLLFGISIIYFITGLMNFYEIDSLLQNSNIVFNNFLCFSGILLFLTSIFFKLSIVPFHMWSPDVYQGAPSIVTFFFSLMPKISFIGILIRLLSSFLNLFQDNIDLLFFVPGVLSLLLGSFASVYQIKLKRLLAYSSITNIGFFVVLLFSINIEALVTSCLFFFIYIFVLTNIFIIFLGFRYYNNFLRIKNIFELFGIFKYNFFFSVILMTNLFSLLGLPPFAGFFTKFFVFINLFESESFILLFVCFFSSLISGYVYIKLIRLIFFNKYNNLLFFVPLSILISFIIIINFLFNILFFKYSDMFFQLFFNAILDNLIINFFLYY